MTRDVCTHAWVLALFHQTTQSTCLFLCLYHVVFMTRTLYYVLNCRMVILLTLLLILGIILAIEGVMCIHINFRIVVSIGIVLNL